MSERLALGTAQFGGPYGISATGDAVTAAETARVLGYASSVGIDTLDTAIAYGDAERRLGEIGVDGWRVVSKLPPLPEDVADVDRWVRKQVAGSLARLGVPRLHGLLLHRPVDLVGPHGTLLADALKAVASEGIVAKIGVSIYDPAELDAVWGFAPTIVQAPLNLVDHRLVTSGWLARLQEHEVEIHVRSVFLQGLLLLPPARRPRAFARWEPLWRRWDDWCANRPASAVATCLAFVAAQPGVSRIIVGVEHREHLEAIVAALATASDEFPTDLASTDQDLISPSRWRLQ